MMKVRSIFLTVALMLLSAFEINAQEEKPQSTHPVWSPDGSKIAFINNHIGVERNNPVNFEIYTMDANGSNVQRHTFNTAFEAEITWSPDGKKLAFKSYRDGNDEVYVLTIATGEQINISNFSGRDGSPHWSDRNDLLYFESRRDSEKGELYSFDLTTREIIRLTNNDIGESGAVWSPDGNEIAFVSDKDGDDDIYVMSLADGNLRQVTNNPLNDWYPRWSHDGRSLIFTYGDWNTDIWETRMINNDGGEEKILIKPVDSGNASWHPKGNYIAFASSKSGEGEIYLYDLNKKQEEKLTNQIRKK